MNIILALGALLFVAFLRVFALADYVARERLYHTADRKKIVKEGDPAAAFLVVGEGTILPEGEAKRLGLTDHMEHYTPQSALDREREALEAAVDRGAHYEAQVRRGVIDRLEHGEAPITRPATDVSGIGVVPTAAVPTPRPERRRSAPERTESAGPGTDTGAGGKK